MTDTNKYDAFSSNMSFQHFLVCVLRDRGLEAKDVGGSYFKVGLAQVKGTTNTEDSIVTVGHPTVGYLKIPFSDVVSRVNDIVEKVKEIVALYDALEVDSQKLAEKEEALNRVLRQVVTDCGVSSRETEVVVESGTLSVSLTVDDPEKARELLLHLTKAGFLRSDSDYVQY